MGDDPRAGVRPLAFVELEHERAGDVLLLDRCLAHIELPRLAVLVGETLRAQPGLGALDGLGIAAEAADRVLPRAALRAPAVRLVVDASLGIDHRHMAILL